MAGAHVSRIIAGARRGMRITMPPTDKTRPTSDRVREALFSAVTSWAGTTGEATEESLRGLSFCDLYAGSGAVGLEAASRGAAPVMLVEANRRTALTATRNVTELDLVARVHVGRVEQLVSQPCESGFDLVFADPPYDLSSATIEALLTRILAQGWVARDGLVVVERPRRGGELGWPDGFESPWSRRYGETLLHFGQVAGAVETPGEP